MTTTTVPFLCRLGWHSWSSWSVLLLQKLHDGGFVKQKTRDCKRCGKVQVEVS